MKYDSYKVKVKEVEYDVELDASYVFFDLYKDGELVADDGLAILGEEMILDKEAAKEMIVNAYESMMEEEEAEQRIKVDDVF